MTLPAPVELAAKARLPPAVPSEMGAARETLPAPLAEAVRV